MASTFVRIVIAANVKGLPMYRKSMVRLLGKLDKVDKRTNGE
jgi:hypothetical protein